MVPLLDIHVTAVFVASVTVAVNCKVLRRLISGIVAVNAEKIMTSGFLVLCIVILHNLAGMGLGLLAGRIFHVEYDKATALAIEVGMQNSGLAITLATANFAANPFATLPGAIFSIWHNISGSLFASLRRSGRYR